MPSLPSYPQKSPYSNPYFSAPLPNPSPLSDRAEPWSASRTHPAPPYAYVPDGIEPGQRMHYTRKLYMSLTTEDYRTIPAWSASTQREMEQTRSLYSAEVSPRPTNAPSEGWSSSQSFSGSYGSLGAGFLGASLPIAPCGSESTSSEKHDVLPARWNAQVRPTPDISALGIAPSWSVAEKGPSYPLVGSSRGHAPPHDAVLPPMPPFLPSPWDPGAPLAQENLKSDKYPCKKCTKGFARPSSLRTHELTHTGEKPFRCQICTREFSVQSNLSRHRKVHTNKAGKKQQRGSKEFGSTEDGREVFEAEP